MRKIFPNYKTERQFAQRFAFEYLKSEQGQQDLSDYAEQNPMYTPLAVYNDVSYMAEHAMIREIVKEEETRKAERRAVWEIFVFALGPLAILYLLNWLF